MRVVLSLILVVLVVAAALSWRIMNRLANPSEDLAVIFGVSLIGIVVIVSGYALRNVPALLWQWASRRAASSESRTDD